MTTLDGEPRRRTSDPEGVDGQALLQQVALAQIARRGLAGGDLDEIFLEALDAVADVLGVASVMVFEHVRSEGELRGRAIMYHGRLVGLETARGLRIPDGRGSMPGYTLEAGTSVTSMDLADDRRFTAQAQDVGLAARSAVTVPVLVDAQGWGVLAVYATAAGLWCDDDVQFVEAVADVLGSIVARHLVEADIRDTSARVDLSLAGGGMGAWTWDIRSDVVELSPAAAEIYGIEPGGLVNADELFEATVHPEDRLGLRGSFHEGIQTGADPHNTYRITRQSDGQLRWIEAWGRLVYEDGHLVRLVGVFADITARRLGETERHELLVAERSARAAAEAAQERMTLLAAASERFGSTLDAEAILAALPELCVPALADVCAVTLADGDGRLTEVGAATVDESTLALVREFRARSNASGDVGLAERVGGVLRHGMSVLLGALTDADRRSLAMDEQQLELARAAGVRSVVIVPLSARGVVIGVMTLLMTESGRHFGEDQLQLAEQLAVRAALAVDNCRLYAAGHRVSRSLQAALLPPALPEIKGVRLAARYRVSEQDLDIGGDFYDVMELRGGAWGIVVGDVCGRGPDAAALTGLVRHSVRTAVVREDEPSLILAQTNDAVLDQIDDARFCTAAYLRVQSAEPATGRVRLRCSTAGHPPPVVLRAGARTSSLLDTHGILLGVVPSPEFVDTDLTLDPGDTVVLYTDGVTEARRGRDFFGEQRLLAALAELSDGDADTIALGLEQAVLAFSDGIDDDMAILVIQARPTTLSP